MIIFRIIVLSIVCTYVIYIYIYTFIYQISALLLLLLIYKQFYCLINYDIYIADNPLLSVKLSMQKAIKNDKIDTNIG